VQCIRAPREYLLHAPVADAGAFADLAVVQAPGRSRE
jgi:hypothetical protein